MSERIERKERNYAQITVTFLLVAGCVFVLQPFLAAILFAAAVAISSWPLYQKLLARMKGRRSLAALVMTLSLLLLVVAPIALIFYQLADDAGRFYEQVRAALETGKIAPPAWLHDLPVVGEWLDKYVRGVFGNRERMLELGKRMVEPARQTLVVAGIAVGTGLAQMSLAAFVSFFLFRDGVRILAALAVLMHRIIGDSAAKVAEIVSHTVRGVMYGLLGTALAQAIVAAIGFAIAGVPAVALLSVATFIGSLVPIGPPIVWGGAAVWLFTEGRTGWGIFMLIWGLVLISGVDNVVKPMLISQGSDLPFLLVLLGVLGGVLAFGFVGLFIGPVLLAVGYTLLRDWIATRSPPLIHLPDEPK
ncbi:MAG: AI-2E family transporter [Pseudomonadota bacterium]